jgi:xanthine dehydrogenase YagR molybdenum-binding subunit
MKFETPATINPIDQLKVVGKPVDRIDGPLKTTGAATYAYEWHDPRSNLAYGYVVGSAIAKGRIASLDLTRAKAAAGVITIVTAENAGTLGKAKNNHNVGKLLASCSPARRSSTTIRRSRSWSPKPSSKRALRPS